MSPVKQDGRMKIENRALASLASPWINADQPAQPAPSSPRSDCPLGGRDAHPPDEITRRLELRPVADSDWRQATQRLHWSAARESVLHSRCFPHAAASSLSTPDPDLASLRPSCSLSALAACQSLAQISASAGRCYARRTRDDCRHPDPEDKPPRKIRLCGSVYGVRLP